MNIYLPYPHRLSLPPLAPSAPPPGPGLSGEGDLTGGRAENLISTLSLHDEPLAARAHDSNTLPEALGCDSGVKVVSAEKGHDAKAPVELRLRLRRVRRHARPVRKHRFQRHHILEQLLEVVYSGRVLRAVETHDARLEGNDEAI